MDARAECCTVRNPERFIANEEVMLQIKDPKLNELQTASAYRFESTRFTPLTILRYFHVHGRSTPYSLSRCTNDPYRGSPGNGHRQTVNVIRRTDCDDFDKANGAGMQSECYRFRSQSCVDIIPKHPLRVRTCAPISNYHACR